ncbi:hypothetical protein EI555_018476, partial [Monodon monoceros]
TSLLLLLLLSPRLRGAPDCSFPHSPISSTFTSTIGKLSDYLLQDYPVTVASNLQDVSHRWEGPGMEDELCGAFWRLVLAQRWMGRLKTVAGSQMEKLLEAPLPSCLRFVQANISHLLQDTSQQLVALKPWITRRNFSRCLELQCQPDSSTLLPPRSPGALGATSLPAPQAPLLLLLLLLLLPVALLLLAAAWCLHWRRKRQRMPYPGERVSQWGGQRAWPESADPLGAIGALPGALTPHQPEDPGLGVGVGVYKPGERGLLEQAEGTASAKPSWCEKALAKPVCGWDR